MLDLWVRDSLVGEGEGEGAKILACFFQNFKVPFFIGEIKISLLKMLKYFL